MYVEDITDYQFKEVYHMDMFDRDEYIELQNIRANKRKFKKYHFKGDWR